MRPFVHLLDAASRALLRPLGIKDVDLEGGAVGDLSATQVGKLTPTYQGSGDNAENYGCGFLSDGRVLTSDVGNQANGDGDGQREVVAMPAGSGARQLTSASMRCSPSSRHRCASSSSSPMKGTAGCVPPPATG